MPCVRYHRPAYYNLILGSAVPLICDNRPKYHQVLIFDASSKERFRRCKLYECYTKVNDSCVRSIDITILDGERARQLANTLLGAKDGGHHHPKRTSALTSLRRRIRCCALATIISWVYELRDRQLAAETVTQARRRFERRKLVNTDARSWRCRPPSLAPNSVLVSRSARSPSIWAP